MASTESVLKTGSLFKERYKIVRSLGKGGMGEVFLAQDNILHDQLIALKVMKPEYSSSDAHISRFIKEAIVTRDVTSQYVVRTFDVGEEGNILFITMEYIEGKNLGDLIKTKGPLPYREGARILIAICEGLAEIHRKSIIHRDLKPGNILIGDRGEVKISDFGIAKTKSSKLTGADEIIGSSHYIAPEIWLGNDLSSATDIYALGVTAYEMFAGCLPFDAEAPAELMWKHLEKKAARPSSIESSVPRWLDEVVLAMLHKNELERPCNALEISDYIRKNLTGEDLKNAAKIVSQRNDDYLAENFFLNPCIEDPPVDLLSKPPASYSMAEVSQAKDESRDEKRLDPQEYRALRGYRPSRSNKNDFLSYFSELAELTRAFLVAGILSVILYYAGPAICHSLSIFMVRSISSPELYSAVYLNCLTILATVLAGFPLYVVVLKSLKSVSSRTALILSILFFFAPIVSLQLVNYFSDKSVSTMAWLLKYGDVILHYSAFSFHPIFHSAKSIQGNEIYYILAVMFYSFSIVSLLSSRRLFKNFSVFLASVLLKSLTLLLLVNLLIFAVMQLSVISKTYKVQLVFGGVDIFLSVSTLVSVGLGWTVLFAFSSLAPFILFSNAKTGKNST